MTHMRKERRKLRPQEDVKHLYEDKDRLMVMLFRLSSRCLPSGNLRLWELEPNWQA